MNRRREKRGDESPEDVVRILRANMERQGRRLAELESSNVAAVASKIKPKKERALVDIYHAWHTKMQIPMSMVTTVVMASAAPAIGNAVGYDADAVKAVEWLLFNGLAYLAPAVLLAVAYPKKVPKAVAYTSAWILAMLGIIWGILHAFSGRK